MEDKSNEEIIEIKPDKNQNTSILTSRKVNSSDLFPVASMLSTEIKPYSDPFKFDDFHSSSTQFPSNLTNASDRIKFETVLTTDSDNAWRYARRSTIFPLNTESQQRTELHQAPQLDPRIFGDFMNQFPSIFNFKAVKYKIISS
jgi:hypothetical protein